MEGCIQNINDFKTELENELSSNARSLQMGKSSFDSDSLDEFNHLKENKSVNSDQKVYNSELLRRNYLNTNQNDPQLLKVSRKHSLIRVDDNNYAEENSSSRGLARPLLSLDNGYHYDKLERFFSTMEFNMDNVDKEESFQFPEQICENKSFSTPLIIDKQKNNVKIKGKFTTMNKQKTIHRSNNKKKKNSYLEQYKNKCGKKLKKLLRDDQLSKRTDKWTDVGSEHSNLSSDVNGVDEDGHLLNQDIQLDLAEDEKYYCEIIKKYENKTPTCQYVQINSVSDYSIHKAEVEMRNSMGGNPLLNIHNGEVITRIGNTNIGNSDARGGTQIGTCKEHTRTSSCEDFGAGDDRVSRGDENVKNITLRDCKNCNTHQEGPQKVNYIKSSNSKIWSLSKTISSKKSSLTKKQALIHTKQTELNTNLSMRDAKLIRKKSRIPVLTIQKKKSSERAQIKLLQTSPENDHLSTRLKKYVNFSKVLSPARSTHLNVKQSMTTSQRKEQSRTKEQLETLVNQSHSKLRQGVLATTLWHCNDSTWDMRNRFSQSRIKNIDTTEREVDKTFVNVSIEDSGRLLKETMRHNSGALKQSSCISQETEWPESKTKLSNMHILKQTSPLVSTALQQSEVQMLKETELPVSTELNQKSKRISRETIPLSKTSKKSSVETLPIQRSIFDQLDTKQSSSRNYVQLYQNKRAFLTNYYIDGIRKQKAKSKKLSLVQPPQNIKFNATSTLEINKSKINRNFSLNRQQSATLQENASKVKKEVKMKKYVLKKKKKEEDKCESMEDLHLMLLEDKRQTLKRQLQNKMKAK